MRIFNETKLFLPLCAFLLLVLSFLLYRNLYARSGGNDEPVIGVVKFKKKKIERKFTEQVAWDEIPSSTEIKNKDTIRTLKDSDAYLELKDGTKVELAENSMIYLNMDGGLNIDFAYGSIQAQAGKKADGSPETSNVKINSRGASINVGSEGALKIEKDSKNTLKVQVLEGEIKLKQEGKEEQKLGTSTLASLTSAGTEVKKVSIRLNTPLDQSVLTNQTVNFSWSGTSANAKVEISKKDDPNYRKVLNATSNTASIALEDGSYRWRVVSGEEESATNSFVLQAIENFQILSPKQNETLNLLGSSIVTVRWTDVKWADEYEILLKPETGTPVTKKTNTNSVSFDLYTPGVYSVSVKGTSQDSKQASNTTNSIRFTVLKEKENKPAVLIEPKNNREYYAASFKQGINFLWKAPVGETSFQLEVSKTPGFEQKFLNKNLESSNYSLLDAMPTGKYYWRVGVKSGAELVYSSVETFVVKDKMELTLLEPKPESVFNIQKYSRIKTSWTNPNFPGRYVVEVSEDRDFSRILTKSETSYFTLDIPNLTPGLYYVRVKLLQDSQELAVSNSSSFVVVEAMPDPVITFPTPNSQVDMSKRNSINFAWNPIPGAIEYNVQLIDKSSFVEKTVTTEVVRANAFVFSNLKKLNEGKSVFIVSAVFIGPDGKKRESNKARVEYFITLQDLQLPKILTPGKFYVE